MLKIHSILLAVLSVVLSSASFAVTPYDQVIAKYKAAGAVNPNSFSVSELIEGRCIFSRIPNTPIDAVLTVLVEADPVLGKRVYYDNLLNSYLTLRTMRQKVRNAELVPTYYSVAENALIQPAHYSSTTKPSAWSGMKMEMGSSEPIYYVKHVCLTGCSWNNMSFAAGDVMAYCYYFNSLEIPEPPAPQGN